MVIKNQLKHNILLKWLFAIRQIEKQNLNQFLDSNLTQKQCLIFR